MKSEQLFQGRPTSTIKPHLGPMPQMGRTESLPESISVTGLAGIWSVNPQEGDARVAWIRSSKAGSDGSCRCRCEVRQSWAGKTAVAGFSRETDSGQA